jgi:hypothetical protein
MLPKSHIVGAEPIARQLDINELFAEQLIRCQTAEQFQFFDGEFHADATHGILLSTAPGPSGAEIEGIESREKRTQKIRAKVMQTALPATAKDTETYPKGPENNRNAGMTTRPATLKATGAV